MPTGNSINCSSELDKLRLKHPKNVILAYLNINSVRNKLHDLHNMINKNVDVLCIAETKLDDSFPEGQFLLDGFHKPFRLDKSATSGGLLCYVNSTIPAEKAIFLQVSR